MRNITVFFLAIVSAMVIYWLKNEIYCRKYNDNSIKVEVTDGLDINKIKIKWQYIDVGSKTFFEHGKQVKDFENLPIMWEAS